MKRRFEGLQLRVCTLLLFVLLSGTLLAQRKVTGTVISAKTNTPLSFATVTVKGTNVATATDNNGNFTITVPAGKEVLTVSSVGYADQDVTVGSGPLTVALQESTSTLNEIVVTGYTSQKKKDLTGSVAVVDVANMNKVPTGSIENQLQGQAAGVSVISSGQPGEEPQIIIRGVNTLNGSNAPLYVVDGVPTGNISDLNPRDVESLQVLKDAGAATIYGSRASNGVVIITTKRGKGKATVSYDGYYGTQRVARGNPYNLLDPQGNADLEWMALSRAHQDNPNILVQDPEYGSGATPVLPDYIFPVGAHEGDASVDPSLYYVNPNYTNPNDPTTFYRIVKANKQGTDWYHVVNKDAPTQNHNLTVSGSSDIGRYFFGLNYVDQEGTVINTFEKRFAIRANTLFNIGKHIRVGENLSYTVTNNPQIGALQEGGTIGYSYREMPIIPVYDIKGNFAGNFGTPLGNSLNPYATAYRTRDNKGLGARLFGNVFGDVDIIPSLTFHTSFGGENYSGYSHYFNYPTYENTENTTSNTYGEGSWWGYNWTWTNTLTYHKVFGKHDVQLLVGTESYNESNENVGGSTTNYFSFDPNFTTLGSGSGAPGNYSGRSYLSLWSQFAKLDYQFNGKYILSATIRRDGASQFSENNKYGYFPSVTAGWRISQENFMKDIAWISDLKIRGGWGVMGNQKPLNSDNQYATFNSDKNASYYDIGGTNNTIVQGFRTGQVPNPDAKWEKDNNTNIGFDATLFKNKLDITFDWYNKNIQDMLYQVPLPATAGNGTAPFVNIGSMKNTGIDLGITGHFNLAKDLRLDAGLTVTQYKNTITHETNGSDYFLLDGRRFGQGFIMNQVGHATSQFYGYKIAGFFNTQGDVDAADAYAKKVTGNAGATYEQDEAVGRFKYVDVNGDGVITDADRTFLGSPHPDFTYGITIGLTYKNFDFSAFFYGTQGNKIWDQMKYWTDLYPTFTGAKSYSALYDSWTPTHMNAANPEVDSRAFFSTTTPPTSYYVENGSYLRSKYMILGYTFDKNLLNKVGISTLRVYVQATNLFTITKYPGVDPEIGSVNTGVTDYGIDEGAYPHTKQFIFGLNVKF
ncbi:MAG TPA: TonB-dependent receptor [Chitinophagaceae bacterium]|nr:TonB-dependent receptor [Chitinophagaceae bacterium]